MPRLQLSTRSVRTSRQKVPKPYAPLKAIGRASAFHAESSTHLLARGRPLAARQQRLFEVPRSARGGVHEPADVPTLSEPSRPHEERGLLFYYAATEALSGDRTGPSSGALRRRPCTSTLEASRDTYLGGRNLDPGACRRIQTSLSRVRRSRSARRSFSSCIFPSPAAGGGRDAPFVSSRPRAGFCRVNCDAQPSNKALQLTG